MFCDQFRINPETAAAQNPAGALEKICDRGQITVYTQLIQ
jgi:hypothetical protein